MNKDLYLNLLKVSLTDQLHHKTHKRLDGRDWPINGFTMIGEQRLNNIQTCVDTILSQNIAGDFLEAGVWKGGATIFMRALLAANDVTNRVVWVADSFEGLPPPKIEYPADADDRHHEFDALAISLEEVKGNFHKFGLLDGQVKFLKGWFDQTLFNAPIEKLALLRLDGDMYESTWITLNALYDKVQPGGFVVVDDYGYIESCRQAVHDFFATRSIHPTLTKIDWTGVYWVKS